MFSFGGQELLIVVVVALLLFGPDKIPQLARTIGRFTREFNKYKSIMEQTLSTEIYKAEGPTKDAMTIEERIAKAGAASDAITEAREAEAAAASGEDAGAGEPGVTAQGAAAGDAGDRPAVPKGQRPTAAPLADETDEEDEE